MDSRYSAVLLKHYKQIALNGTLDLRWMFEWRFFYSGCNNLSTYSEIYLKITLAEHLINSNWNVEHLTTEQVEYAALSAIVAFDLFQFISGDKSRPIG